MEMNNIEPLDWDSQSFGYKVGKIRISGMNVPGHFFQEAEDYNLVYIFSDHQLSAAGLPLVDRKITLEKEISPPFPNTDYQALGLFDPANQSMAQLEQLAFQSGIFSRFKVDPNFRNGEFEKLYSEWVGKLAAGGEHANVWVKAVDGELVGFIGVDTKDPLCAGIELVAVSAKMRSKGFGKHLLGFALQELKRFGFPCVKVVTQENNLPAMKLYEQFGFKVTWREFVYHYWNL